MKTRWVDFWGTVARWSVGQTRISLRTVTLLLVVVTLVLEQRGSLLAADSGEAIRFSNAVMFTPVRTNMETRLFQFAPLLVFETPATNLAGWKLADCFGLAEVSQGALQVKPPQPAAYALKDVVVIRDRVFESITYLWWRPPIRSNTSPVLQGLRITITPEGQPLVYEIHDSSAPGRRVVVTRSLEAAAQKTFGGPLPGRRFAVERPAADRESAEVLRAIDDGPLELGPVVYLRGGDGRIATVICRCMPSQVQSIAETGYYQLRELSAGLRQRLEDEIKKAFGHSTLEQILRLPDDLPGTPASP